MTRSRRAILGAGLALALAAGGWLLVRGLRGGSPDRNRVAVSVFVNRTGDPSLEPLGSMVADWVTRGLSQTGLVDVVDVGAIHVQGRSSAGEPTDPSDLARRNGAGTVVSGSYYLATDTLVIRATVEDAICGTVLQTVPAVHVPAKEAVRALDQLREHVFVALGGVFDVRYSPFTARPSAPRSFQAYQAFVAGQEAYWRGRPPDEVRALLEQAVTEDSSFLASQVWLSDTAKIIYWRDLTGSAHCWAATRRSAPARSAWSGSFPTGSRRGCSSPGRSRAWGALVRPSGMCGRCRRWRPIMPRTCLSARTPAAPPTRWPPSSWSTATPRRRGRRRRWLSSGIRVGKSDWPAGTTGSSSPALRPCWTGMTTP